MSAKTEFSNLFCTVCGKISLSGQDKFITASIGESADLDFFINEVPE